MAKDSGYEEYLNGYVVEWQMKWWMCNRRGWIPQGWATHNMMAHGHGDPVFLPMRPKHCVRVLMRTADRDMSTQDWVNVYNDRAKYSSEKRLQ